MARTRIEVSFDLEDWKAIVVGLALVKMPTAAGDRFIAKLVERIILARDQDCREITELRDRARAFYRRLKGADILIDEEATVYTDGEGGKWVQGCLRVPEAPAARKDGIVSLDTNLAAFPSKGGRPAVTAE